LLLSYSAAIDLASLVAGFVLDAVTQLQYLATCQTLGPGAYKLASNVGDLGLGLRLLEQTRGIVWSQLLHLREPQLQNVPPRLSAELSASMRYLESKTSVGKEHLPKPHLTERDARHQHNSRIQQLSRQIRTLPDLAHFMRGDSSQTLMETAAMHPVVVLVPTGNQFEALIILSCREPLISLQLPDIEACEVTELIRNSSISQFRSTASDDVSPRLGFSVSTPQKRSKFHRMLARLWEGVVKPIISHLGISVNYFCVCLPIEADACDTRRSQEENGPGSIGVQQASLHSHRCMQLAYTMVISKRVAQIT
jgi:hypothetical protein